MYKNGWPGKVPLNTVCRQPSSNVDFYPTFLDAIGRLYIRHGDALMAYDIKAGS
jgi:hypothetical protein